MAGQKQGNKGMPSKMDIKKSARTMMRRPKRKKRKPNQPLMTRAVLRLFLPKTGKL